MDKKKDDILTKAFKERLENYKLPVSDDVWKRIEQDLPPQKNNIHLFWQRIGIAATIAMLLGLGGYFFYFQMDLEKSRMSDFFEKQPMQETPIPQNPKATPLILTNQSALVHKKAKESDINASACEPIQETKEVLSINETSEEQQNKPKKIKQDIIPNPDSQDLDIWIDYPKQKTENNMSLALAYVGQGTTAISNGNSDPLQRYSKTFPRIMNVNADLPDNTVISDIKYKTPITVGLSIRKHLTPKWALESGLTYTYLESTETLTRLNGDYSTKNVQLNYLGIPLKIVYSFYTNNRLSLYASAGGMVEKNIYGKEKLSTNQKATKLDIPELQWSLSGNIGLNYKLVEHFDLFVEPGIGYYFDDKSGIETIRKDKPWNLGLQVGVRLTLD